MYTVNIQRSALKCLLIRTETSRCVEALETISCFRHKMHNYTSLYVTLSTPWLCLSSQTVHQVLLVNHSSRKIPYLGIGQKQQVWGVTLCRLRLNRLLSQDAALRGCCYFLEVEGRGGGSSVRVRPPCRSKCADGGGTGVTCTLG